MKSSPKRLPPSLEPLAISRSEAADFIGVSTPTWVAAIKKCWRSLCDEQAERSQPRRR
jgi:hypothetical protein